MWLEVAKERAEPEQPTLCTQSFGSDRGHLVDEGKKPSQCGEWHSSILWASCRKSVFLLGNSDTLLMSYLSKHKRFFIIHWVESIVHNHAGSELFPYGVGGQPVHIDFHVCPDLLIWEELPWYNLQLHRHRVGGTVYWWQGVWWKLLLGNFQSIQLFDLFPGIFYIRTKQFLSNYSLKAKFLGRGYKCTLLWIRLEKTARKYTGEVYYEDIMPSTRHGAVRTCGMKPGLRLWAMSWDLF